MNRVKIYADFNNADSLGRLRLTTNGSLVDIDSNQLKLVEGQEIDVDDDEGLSAFAIIEFSAEEKIWVARIDWDKIREK